MIKEENHKRCFSQQHLYPIFQPYRLLLILFVAVMPGLKQSYAYSQTLTVNHEKISLTAFLRLVKQQTDYSVIASKNTDLAGKTLHHVHFNNISLAEVLNKVLPPIGLSHRLEDKLIVLSTGVRPVATAKPSSGSLSNTFLQERIEVSGTVRDSLGTPLTGVSIAVKNRRSVTTATDAQGKYSLEINKGETLQFTYMGYRLEEIVNIDRPNIDVEMRVVAQDLDEVVIVASGRGGYPGIKTWSIGINASF